jgi:hypothetical protein
MVLTVQVNLCVLSVGKKNISRRTNLATSHLICYLLSMEKVCFWCEKILKKQEVTRDHLIPLGMGGKDGKGTTVPCCRSCNAERGKVTELYSDRNHMLRYIANCPERITSYKNRFRKKVKKMQRVIIKWELLHREKGIILPFDMLEVVRLDETMPIGV